jgi:hypothetical protein
LRAYWHLPWAALEELETVIAQAQLVMVEASIFPKWLISIPD